jgi:hypothetical protein
MMVAKGAAHRAVLARTARLALGHRPAGFYWLVAPYAFTAACAVTIVATIASGALLAVMPVPRGQLFTILGTCGVLASGWYGEQAIQWVQAWRRRQTGCDSTHDHFFE